MLGIAPATYYRQRQRGGEPRAPRPGAIDAVLPAEHAAVVRFARLHPELRHRALAWTMVDQDVACVSPSTTYRILVAAALMRRWQPPVRVPRRPLPQPSGPNESWQTDLRYVQVAERTYYLLVFLDVWSRVIVYHELLRWMDGDTVAVAAQAALETVPVVQRRRIRLQSDNGSAFVSGEFAQVLRTEGVGHHRIRPRTPEQNAFVERVLRTVSEPLHEAELASYQEAQKAIGEIIAWYNHDRLHSALGYVTPAAMHTGQAAQIQEERRQKLRAARQHRRAENLRRRQLALPLEPRPATPSDRATLHTRLSPFG